MKTPVRKVQDTRYYNEQVHRAAFVLPEFGRALIEEGKNITPKFGREGVAIAQANKPKKKVLLLGSGFVARPAAEYIVRDPSNSLTIGESNCLISDVEKDTDICSACRTLRLWK